MSTSCSFARLLAVAGLTLSTCAWVGADDKPSAPSAPAAPTAPKAPDAPKAPAAPKAPDMDPQAMMEAWMKMSQPGESHQQMAKFEGSWKAAVKMWDPMNPGAAPMESPGSMDCKLILGGRFIQAHYKGEMMGMPFDGMMLWGYNNADGKWESTWMDSFSTGIMMSTGTSTDGGKTVNSSGNFKGPGPDGKIITYTQRERMTWVSDDELLLEMWHSMPGSPEGKVMEIRYTRAKDAKSDGAPADAKGAGHGGAKGK